MSIEHCCCNNCVVAAIEQIEELTAYAVDLESMFRVLEQLVAAGDGAAAYDILRHGAKLARERDLMGETHTARMQQAVEEAAAARAAHRLH